MATGILSEFPAIGGSYARHAACAGCAIPNVRMRLLHFENTFGDTYASEYSLDAMISLVLLIARSSRPDADRLTRLTATASAPLPAATFSHNDRSGCNAAPARHVG